MNVGFDKKFVRQYVPRSPIRCFNCQRFWHFASLCKENPICSICGGKHHFKTCEAVSPKCANCDKNHQSNSKECRNYKIEMKKKMKENKKRSISNQNQFSNLHNMIFRDANDVEPEGKKSTEESLGYKNKEK